ncbi:hypothetical protein [Pseudomonas sp. R-28-1W-6]|uniref:hypothetical protein n=1 Tax=Pseudomonas sp. R-28-1W-6 TaxID=2650101 RepID=UPI002114AADA|nr:hypothetical protein [Pseudomonas sp. R-28-1W-6]
MAWLVCRRGTGEQGCCDVLLIHPSCKSYLQGRKKPLVAALRARGMRVEEFVEDSERRLIFARQLAVPRRPVPFLLHFYAAHAAYLLQRYRPKVVLTERNAWVVPSLVKALREEGAQVMHLAHSVPSGQSSRYDYFDYDYYALFGRSSFEYLASIPGRFGSCVTVFAGPYYLSDRLQPEAPVSSPGGRPQLLFLGSGPDYEQTPDYLECCAWVMKWLQEHPDADLTVKIHPRASGHPWVAHATANARVRMLAGSVSLDECAGRFDLVLCGYTNAVLDVARAGIPFVLLGNDEDYFSVERFGLPRCRVESQLASSIEGVAKSPEDYRRSLAQFMAFHIDQSERPLASLVECVEQLVGGHALPGEKLSAEIGRH